MNIETCPIEGLLLVKPRIFRDERGMFVESWQQRRYEDMGVCGDFVQDNHSVSRKDVLRGIHFQIEHPQGKLVSVSFGAVFDVAVDLRTDSSTFGKWHGVELSAENQHQFWIPPGFGHAFCVLSDFAHFHYKCTDYYVPGDEGTIIWNDPEIGVAWPLKNPILSEKDRGAPSLSNWKIKLGG